MYKRFEMRRSAGLSIDLITSYWDEPVSLVASDITPHGAYIESEVMPVTGEHLVCSFNLSNSLPEYCFFGEVTRVNLLRRKTDRTYPGFGIKFLDTHPFHRLNIRQALRGLPPPVPTPKREYWKLFNYTSMS
jgi:hypothetical protein